MGDLLGADALLNQGPLQLTAEFQHVWRQRSTQLENTQSYGGSVDAAYFLTGEHMPWSRKLGILGRAKPNPEGSAAWVDRTAAGTDTGLPAAYAVDPSTFSRSLSANLFHHA